MKRFFILMTVLVALMTGCDPQTGTDAGNGGGTGNDTPSGGGNGGATGTAAAELVSMDITDAESIYISTPTEAGETVSAKAGVTARTISERAAARGFAGSVLFKITKEGKAVEISLTWGNDKNENTAQLRPVIVHKTGTDYVIIEFYNPTIRQTIPYLINKKTGKAYSLEEVGVPQQNGENVYDQRIFTDADNNLYYKTLLPYPRNGKTQDIVRINVSDSDKPAVQFMVLPQDMMEDLWYPEGNSRLAFAVDNRGNLIYESQNGARVIFRDGGFSVAEGVWVDDLYLGPDGHLYRRESDGEQTTIIRYEFDALNRTFTGKPVASFSQSFYHSDGFNYFISINGNLISIESNSYLILYHSEDMSRCGGRSFEGIFSIGFVSVAVSGECYYLAGQDQIDNQEKVMEINPFTGTYRQLPGLDDYAVYQISGQGEQLTFAAVRKNDGKLVVGKMKSDGTGLTIIDDKSNGNVTYLTPIN